MKIIYLKSANNVEYSGLYSKADNSKTIIIHVHGMAGSITLNKFYNAMHLYYPEHGISFLCPESQGTGSIVQYNKENELVSLGNAFEIFENSIDDIQSYINWAREQGYEKIWLSGHSLGCNKISYFVANSNEDISGLILISPPDMNGFKYFDEEKDWYDRNIDKINMMIAAGEGSKLFPELFWSSYISANSYKNLSDNENIDIFHYYDLEKPWQVLNGLHIPVIIFTGTKDSGVIATCPDAHIAMDTLKQQLIQSPNVEIIVYENAEHSFDGFENNIVTDVVNFIKHG